MYISCDVVGEILIIGIPEAQKHENCRVTHSEEKIFKMTQTLCS